MGSDRSYGALWGNLRVPANCLTSRVSRKALTPRDLRANPFWGHLGLFSEKDV